MCNKFVTSRGGVASLGISFELCFEHFFPRKWKYGSVCVRIHSTIKQKKSKHYQNIRNTIFLVSGFCYLICKACLILKIGGKIDLKINWSVKTLLDGHKGVVNASMLTQLFSSSISIDWYQKSIIIEFYRLLAPSRLQDSLAFFRSFALVESLAQANRLSVYRLTTPDVGNDYHSCSRLACAQTKLNSG